MARTVQDKNKTNPVTAQPDILRSGREVGVSPPSSNSPEISETLATREDDRSRPVAPIAGEGDGSTIDMAGNEAPQPNGDIAVDRSESSLVPDQPGGPDARSTEWQPDQ